MNPRENLSRSKEVLGAYLRMGAKELGNAFYDGGSVAQHAELGMAFTKTPGEITAGMRGESVAAPSYDDTSPSMLDRYTQPAPEQENATPERDSHTIEQEAPEIDRE